MSCAGADSRGGEISHGEGSRSVPGGDDMGRQTGEGRLVGRGRVERGKASRIALGSGVPGQVVRRIASARREAGGRSGVVPGRRKGMD